MRNYHRLPRGWIARRARRLQRAYRITRRIAVAFAASDYSAYTGTPRERLSQLLTGGQNHETS